MLDLAILGLLSDQELHGYELTKRLPELLGSPSTVSFGSVYPALSRLERDGLVKAVEAAARVVSPVPMTGSLAGELAAARSRTVEPSPTPRRARKVYGITADGEARLIDQLTDPAGAATAASFDLRLALFHHLDAAQRLAIIEQRCSILRARLAELRRATPGDPYQLARHVRELASIEYDMAWLANLARAEQAQSNPGDNS
jgi:DNA-binding PadR family transcriptional regulator